MNFSSMRQKSVCLFLSFMFLFVFLLSNGAQAAPSWPNDVSVSAEGVALMDADSGCMIYGRNLHRRYYPASITKILTALIIVERCNLDDTLTFSYDAVHRVERGSTSAGYDTGDQITVREALYAMLLKSANEVANALAEHCAGSMEAFAKLMNEKAASLGCKDSSFVNPSGLNDNNHYTTAYDFALIAQAAFQNPVFVEFDSTTYYEMPVNATNDKPFMVYCGHKMMKKNSGHYYPGIIGGKTGYTVLAGNTLVTCAERDGLKLISVILNGHQTHYADTAALLDFGFAHFKNEPVRKDSVAFLRPEENLNLSETQTPLLTLDTTRSITLPKDALPSDVRAVLNYDFDKSEPKNTVAQVRFLFGDRVVGTSRLSTDAAVEVTDLNHTVGRDKVHPLRRMQSFFLRLKNGDLNSTSVSLFFAVLFFAVGIFLFFFRLNEKRQSGRMHFSKDLPSHPRSRRRMKPRRRFGKRVR